MSNREKRPTEHHFSIHYYPILEPIFTNGNHTQVYLTINLPPSPWSCASQCKLIPSFVRVVLISHLSRIASDSARVLCYLHAGVC